ncbi:MAG: MBL fold metallo-hydrolase [Candidatus Schekmanbacteria bacterium]|nr:MBL fold metallo-hydrolase [Candidatus Schekmanbacteria bacterium]
MIVKTFTLDAMLANTYLVCDRPGGHGVLVDAGAPPEPILDEIARLGISLTHVLLTHHHWDHSQHAEVYRHLLGASVCCHERELPFFPAPEQLDQTLADGSRFASGKLAIHALHVPGHTAGQLAFLIDEEAVFTGDTLFRHGVGGTMAVGHTTVTDLRQSVVNVLLALPARVAVYPGHAGSSTVAEEWEHNAFARAWSGRDPVLPGHCRAFARPATLFVRGEDYDGGTKCWVRFDDDGTEAVVAGSKVVEAR